jgi:hypothetical protein
MAVIMSLGAITVLSVRQFACIRRLMKLHELSNAFLYMNFDTKKLLLTEYQTYSVGMVIWWRNLPVQPSWTAIVQ